ncbi:NlpC/P60 family protein [Metaclostridioides mangenotii]|uniref:XkdQ/YqbQ family protein n=1 Tax=Metaclostridioides mangenotii TaxID=1540 RepID=UPI0028E6EFD2|nr:NlpC/P60 family protein [Clostridioides mangenotii]
MSILSDAINSAENLYNTLKKVKGIKLWVHPLNKPVYDLTDLVEKVTWSGDYKSPSRTLEFSVFSSAVDINTPSLDLPVGSTVCFYHNNTELFRGMVIDRSRNSGNNNINYTCKDIGSRLVRSKYAYNFADEKPEDIANKLLKDNGFAVGEVLKTDYKYTKIFMQSSIYDIIMSAYTSATSKTGKKYMITTDIDKINVVEKGKTKLKVAFNEEDNLINTSFSESIDNVVNKVVLIDQAGNKVNELKDDESIKKYGVLQDIVQQQAEGAGQDLKSSLQDVKKTCNLKGYGDTSCITGYGVEVKDTYTGLVGLFYIDSDKHTWTPGDYSIDLELNFQNIMDEHFDGQDPQPVETGETGGDGVMEGVEHPAIITAYWPGPSKMEGGDTDQTGKKLDPSKQTCAGPQSIAYGKKVQILGTGTDKDGKIYTKNDNGGRMVVDGDGYYHIDILMRNNTECNKWGKRKGRIIVGDGVIKYPSNGGGYTASGSSAVAKSISFAKGKLGTPYKWGGTGPQYDCSGLTQAAYKSAGITIPRNSRAQAKAGTYVERKNLRRGDLVFFGDNNYITHVGMFMGNNEFIHSPSTGDKVKISKLEGRYSRRFITARRFA